MTQGDPLTVFVSYSHRDEAWRKRLEAHLALLEREGQIAIWHDRKIGAGEPWAERISVHLETADLVLLLVSADFLNSDYCYATEMTRALERHQEGTTRVVPIVVRACDWQSARFGKLQAVPRDDRAVASQADEDAAWTEVARELRSVVEEIRAERAGRPAPEPEPHQPNERLRGWSRRLRQAYDELEETTVAGGDTRAIEDAIGDLRRHLREGGLAAGDFLDRGRLRLIEEIGAGGFATVWKAWDRRRRTAVAVKVLHARYARDASRRERFLRGAARMAALRHPAIVRVLDSEGRDGRFFFFVMELADDGDLHRAVLDGRLPEVAERLRRVADVGEALAHAHGEGVIHRDVKPHNVLLDGAGRTRLTDFDLVRAVDSAARTRTGSMLGTFGYAAPEVLFNAKEAGVEADVYGLGMTAAFAVHGRDLPAEVIRDAPAFVARLGTSDEVRATLTKAVAWEPTQRYRSMAEFGQDLRAAIESAAGPVSGRHRRAGAPRPTAPSPVRAEPGIEALFRWIETRDGRVDLWREISAGNFRMGSPEGEGRDSERPQHEVRITKPFRMAVVPVTNAQFRVFEAKHRPRTWKEVSDHELGDHPVVGASWQRAVAFCEWLAKTFEWARGARLPTEEEWEYACRAGTETRYWSGDGEEDLARVGWYDENSGGRTHRVGRKDANPWGLHDVHGNVWEWTLSPWTGNYSGHAGGRQIDPAAADPAGRASPGGVRVIRGGSYRFTAGGARSAYRSWDRPGFVLRNQGFRVLLPAP